MVGRFFLAFSIALAAVAGPAAALDGALHLAPPETANHGSGYTAIAAHPNGKVYVGAAFYGGSASVLELDPAGKRWKILCDSHQVTRETGTGLNSQSKFHAKIQIDADGLVWAATKQGNEIFDLRPEYGEDPRGYPGGHLFSCEPRSGQVIDHGILMKQEGLMGGAINPQRRRLYYWSDPKQHFLVYDIAANRVTDKGSMGGSPRYTPIDARGRVFGSAWPERPGALWMYDPETDKLTELAVRLEGPGPCEDPYVLVTGADGNRLFGCALQGKRILEYDLTGIRLERPGQETVPGVCGTIRAFDRGETPAPGGARDQHAGALGADGCFYVLNAQRVVRYDPRANKIEDLGPITTGGAPLAKASTPQGAAVGRDGTLYAMYIYPLSVVEFDRLTAPAGGRP
jgi:hypothetical protein